MRIERLQRRGCGGLSKVKGLDVHGEANHASRRTATTGDATIKRHCATTTPIINCLQMSFRMPHFASPICDLWRCCYQHPMHFPWTWLSMRAILALASCGHLSPTKARRRLVHHSKVVVVILFQNVCSDKWLGSGYEEHGYENVVFVLQPEIFKLGGVCWLW